MLLYQRQLLLRSKIALAFLTVFPTPQAAAELNQTELAAFYRRYAIDRMSVEAGTSPVQRRVSRRRPP